MMFWSDHDMSGWGYTGMVIGMVLFWALIIVGIVALIRFSTGATQTRAIGQPQSRGDYETPEQLLAGRFARGEVDEAEYRQRLEVLRTTRRQ
ncbi:MAG: SHOCT domain-containing protein [Candidatus Nanopelagicales bacterium]